MPWGFRCAGLGSQPVYLLLTEIITEWNSPTVKESPAQRCRQRAGVSMNHTFCKMVQKARLPQVSRLPPAPLALLPDARASQPCLGISVA